MRNNERGKELRELRTRARGKRLELEERVLEERVLEERVLEELNTKFPLCCNCTKEKPLPETRNRSESLRTSIAVASTKWTALVWPGCSIYLVAEQSRVACIRVKQSMTRPWN